MPRVSRHTRYPRRGSLLADAVRRCGQFAAVLALCAVAPTAHAVVAVEAGPASSATVDTPVTLSGSVTGQSILDFTSGDGANNSIWQTENMLITYDDINGFGSVGPLQSTTGHIYGWPSGLAREDGGTAYGVDTFHQRVYVLDETTGIVTPFADQAGGSSWNTRMGSLSYDSVNNILYSIDFSGASDRLWSFDLATQLWTLEYVGLPSSDARGAALDKITSLLFIYDANTNQIYTLDPANGATANVVQPTLDPGPAFQGVALLFIFFDEVTFYKNELYGILHFGIDDGNEALDYGQIQHIDLATGATRNIGPVIVGADPKTLILDSVPEVLEWTVDSGPGVVTFADAEDPTTSATFSTPGAYVLRLTAHDSPVVFDTVTVTASHTCNDGIDQDGDGFFDYPDDPGCSSATDTTETDASLFCDDGLDNDADGLVDASNDPGCTSGTDSTETNPLVACDDGLDNDLDGATDHTTDSGCADPEDTTETSAMLICDDGLDNDGDGLTDLADPGCSTPLGATEKTPGLVCDDGIDNDGDGMSDFPTDPGCSSPGDTAETSPSLPCDDGIDNDGDNFWDHTNDPGCASATSPTESPACQDGIDNDGDGRLDFDGGLSALGVDAPSPLVPDLGCFSDPIRDSEVRQACGLGAELVVVLPIWVFFRKRRSQRAAAAA